MDREAVYVLRRGHERLERPERSAKTITHHRIPKSKGGTNTLANIDVCCKRCNSEKGSMLPEEFAAAIRKEKGGPPGPSSARSGGESVWRYAWPLSLFALGGRLDRQ
jgi:5-methylcytosine-specific restriction endonuclease McrA